MFIAMDRMSPDKLEIIVVFVFVLQSILMMDCKSN